MSTEIDYQRKAYHYEDKYGDRCYVVLQETGSSNCFEVRPDGSDGRRARNWYVRWDGPAYSVYSQITHYAGAAAGGVLVIGRMGNWRSGDYLSSILKVLKAYDKSLQGSRPIEEATPVEQEMIREFRARKAVA